MKNSSKLQTKINRKWFKNRLRNNEFVYKCDGKFTDDYAYDMASDFFKTKKFIKAPKDLFNDWYLSIIDVFGNKNGAISVVFASCEYYTFILKQVYKLKSSL